MNVHEAIKKRRTIRKFTQEKIEMHKLVTLIDCARVAAYGANSQPLKFAIIDDKEMLDKIFPNTKWAALLSDGTPKENERPTAYIAVLGDSSIKPSKVFEVEAGAAVTTMMLEAVEMGLGSCWLGAIQREEIKKILGLAENLELVYLLALGYPAQESKSIDMVGDDTKYFLDENKTVNVPKRKLSDVIVAL
jgi:nitroreductase